jgi:hypothetical protein
MKHRIMSLTTDSVHAGTQQAVSLHRRNVAEDDTGMTEIWTTSSVAEMHVAGSKTGVKSTSALNRSSVKKGTMTTMVSITTHLTDSVLSKGGHNPGGVKAFSHNLKRVHWPLNFESLGIEKYDGYTNLAEWLEV